jgi:hypothetical protein
MPQKRDDVDCIRGRETHTFNAWLYMGFLRLLSLIMAIYLDGDDLSMKWKEVLASEQRNGRLERWVLPICFQPGAARKPCSPSLQSPDRILVMGLCTPGPRL